MLELARYKLDKETKEEILVPFFLYRSDVLCLYRDRRGCFILNTQGYMCRVPYKLHELKEYLGL